MPPAAATMALSACAVAWQCWLELEPEPEPKPEPAEHEPEPAAAAPAPEPAAAAPAPAPEMEPQGLGAAGVRSGRGTHRRPPVVYIPRDAAGCQLDRTADGLSFVDPITGVAFTLNALKRHCKRQEKVVAASAKARAKADALSLRQATGGGLSSAAALAVPLAVQYAEVAEALEQLETRLRRRHHPELGTRPEPTAADIEGQRRFTLGRRQAGGADQEEDARVVTQTVAADISDEGASASLAGRGLRQFTLAMLPPPPPCCTVLGEPLLTPLLTLDLSHNELVSLPDGFGAEPALSGLENLSLAHNWLQEVPVEASLDSLTSLTSLNLRNNFLRPNTLALAQLKKLPLLVALDLRFNQKCGQKSLKHFSLRTLLTTELPELQSLQLTLSAEQGTIPGAFVGTCASMRDASLLRSQLEPWGTTDLRRRLTADFGCELQPDEVTGEPAGRPMVMETLLRAYNKEAETELQTEQQQRGQNEAVEAGGEMASGRKLVRVSGTPVPVALLDELLMELRAWVGSAERNRRERPSIQAQSYMVRPPPSPPLPPNTRQPAPVDH